MESIYQSLKLFKGEYSFMKTQNRFIMLIFSMIYMFLMGNLAMAVQSEDPIMVKNSKARKDAIKRFEKRYGKKKDVPNPKDLSKLLDNHKLLNEKIKQYRLTGLAPLKSHQFLTATDKTAEEITRDKVLVILVEFGGTDTFTWDPASSVWDPIGSPLTADDTGADYGTPAACANIITEKKTFTYSGPLHNQIPRPANAEEDFDGENLVDDFSPQHYYELIFGNGVNIEYTRGDGSVMSADFTGKSVADYFTDISNGTYLIEGEVLGWVQVNHSTWHYGADFCPGARSVGRSSFADAAIEGAGTTRTFVIDTLEATKAAYPDFDWAQYDMDGDGVIDRLWIIHAGIGEEEGSVMVDATEYGEAAIWSHSSGLGENYEIVPGVFANAYITMPENSGIAVLAHESGHNLGADDLYSYGDGETSAGFWSLMADSWTGYPIGFQPGTVDPWHLDGWGWLNPKLIIDDNVVYNFTIGQASNFPGGEGVFRGAKIALEDGQSPFAVTPNGSYQWWGNETNQSNAMMTLNDPIFISGANATLSVAMAYNIEAAWDFMWVQVSTDNGTTWDTLTNTNTVCEHDSGWIGSAYGFPDDLCAAGIGGFSGHNAGFPSYETETFDLSVYDGQSLLLRFWYMTDWGSLEKGPYLDDVVISSDSGTLFSDGAEAGDDNWTYADGWQRVGATKVFTHNYYLQWRNVGADGGYDSALGDERWRYGPANTGLLVWYNNNLYPDNELADYMTDFPSIGPKGRELIIDAHPEPYRDPYYLGLGYNNEAANLHDTLDNGRYNRGSMRDAAFSLNDSVPFSVHWPYVYEPASFPGRPAVSLFQDSLGYYAGAEYTTGAPTSSSYYWMTREWDGSAVVPSRNAYPFKADGYAAGDFLIWGIQVDQTDGTNGWDYAGYAVLDTNGGNGNPSQTGGSYGWNVKILSQTNQKARIAVWNSNQTQPFMLTIVKSGDGSGSIRELTNNLINCGEYCSAMVKDGDSVTLSAIEDSGSVFAGWESDQCFGTEDCTLTISNDTTITAKFVQSNYKIEVEFEQGCKIEFIPGDTDVTSFEYGTPGTNGPCEITGEGSLGFRFHTVGWKLTNTGDFKATIDRIFVTWPDENGELKKIKLDWKMIHVKKHSPPTADIDKWIGPKIFRTIKSGRTDELKFRFKHHPIP